jgi:prevent-host-death family protein
MTLHLTKAEVGVRELHDHLSRYVQHVAEGHDVVVTMRGKPVARLAPLDATDPFATLRAQGLVQEPTETWRPRGDRPVPSEPVADLIVKQRR